MTDYWKSNDRKYCDFCKCWISDNKASVSFHENGKRHKLNVSKRISEISRNSEKAEKERKQMNADIRKMEEAAMRSYAQDIHAKNDMTARSVHAIMDKLPTKSETYKKSIGTVVQGQIDPMRLAGSDDEEDRNRVLVQKVSPESIPNASLWVESISDEGHTYYWNVKTNESVWKEPEEGYLSWAEYQNINDLAIKQKEIEQAEEAKRFRENVNEEVARYNREKLKKFRKLEPQVKRENNPYKTEEEATTQQIGSWQVVESKPPPTPIDWQLPKTSNQYIAPVVQDIPAEPPVKRFKEKMVETLDAEVVHGTASVFKKRKNINKGNARRRMDDD